MSPREGGGLNRLGKRLESRIRLYPDQQADGVLYIGVNADLPTRIEQHRSGAVSSFTKKYNRHVLMWFERFENIHEARAVERQMKMWNRSWKIKRIVEMNPGWCDLASPTSTVELN